jgi:hypothetical protein
MTELKSEEVKNAVAARLLRIASVAVYKEAVTVPLYPHFFVHLVSVTDEEQRKNHHILTYSFDLRYRVASDPSTDLRLEQKLDEMALKLMAGLNIIECNDVKIRIEDKNYEKTEGVLHFFCKVNLQAELVDLGNTIPKQEKLDVSIEVKNGGQVQVGTKDG